MPTNTDNDYELLFKSTLAEKNSKIIYLNYMPVLDTRECLRHFPLNDPRKLDKSLRALDEYSSSINFENGIKQRYINIPVADQTEKLKGTWRVVYNRGAKEGEPEGIYQLLRENWATTLSEDEAKIGQTTENPSEETFLFQRVWYNIDNTYIAPLVKALNETKTITNPKIEGKIVTGTFAISNTNGSKRDDGSGIIQQNIAIVNSISGSSEAEKLTSLNGVNHRVLRSNEILQELALSTGEDDTIMYLWSGLSPDDETKLFALSDNGLRDKFVDSTWTYKDRKFEQQKDGTCTFSVMFQKIAWNAFDATSPDLTWYENKDREHEKLNQSWFKIKNDDSLTDLYTATSGYNIINVTISERGDGALNVLRVQLDETAGAAADGSTPAVNIEESNQIIIDPHGIVTGTLNQIIIINENLASKSSAYGTPSDTSYTLVKSEEKLTANGLWNKYYIYEKPIWRSWDDATAADTISYNNKGTHAEQRTEVWKGIDKADRNTATSALVDGGSVDADTGYTVSSVTVTDNRNGSVTITRVQNKMVIGSYDDSNSGNIIDKRVEDTNEITINAHSLQSGTLNRVKIINENLDDTSSAYTTLLPRTGYTVIDKEEKYQSNGLWTVIHTYEKTTWRTWDSETTPDVTTTEYNYKGEANEKVIKTWVGIDNSSRTYAETAIQTAPAGYVVDSIRVNDAGNGSVTLVQTLSKINSWDNSSADLTLSIDNEGTHSERRSYLWYNIDNTDISDAITALSDGGAIGATNTNWTVDTIRISDNHNGTSNITQSQIKKTIGASGDEIENTGETKIRPFSLFGGGTKNTLTIINDNLDSISDAYVIGSDTSGYTLVDKQNKYNAGTGLWAVIYTYEKVTFTKTWSNKKEIAENGASTIHTEKTYAVEDVPSGSLSLSSITAETDYVIGTKRISDRGDGSGSMLAREIAENTTPTSIEVEFTPAKYRKPEKQIKIWHDVSLSTGNDIVTDSKLATPTDYPFESGHELYSIRINYHTSDELVDVIRATWKPIWTTTTWATKPSGSTGLTQDYLESRINRSYASGSEHRTWTYTYDIGYENDESTARTAISTGKNGRYLRSTVWRTRGSFWGWRKITKIASGAWSETSVAGETSY